MQTSDTINELTTALSKAQGEITGALKESANPFFKSRYADLASCWDACRGPLSKNGLAVFQAAETTSDGLVLTTTLAHGSGQWMRSSLGVTPKDDSPQSMGSALTYARRYALTAMVGIAQVDDDGNAASGRPSTVSEIKGHDPRGEMGKDIPTEEVQKASAQMRDIMDMDVEEPIKALKVLDYHDILNRNQDLYVAAADGLGSKLKNAWKVYVSLAKAAQKADTASSRR